MKVSASNIEKELWEMRPSMTASATKSFGEGVLVFTVDTVSNEGKTLHVCSKDREYCFHVIHDRLMPGGLNNWFSVARAEN